MARTEEGRAHPIARHELRHDRERIAHKHRRERNGNVQAQPQCEQRRGDDVDGQGNEGNEQPQGERARDVAAVHAPIRRVFEHGLEGFQEPPFAQFMASPVQAFDDASRQSSVNSREGGWPRCPLRRWG